METARKHPLKWRDAKINCLQCHKAPTVQQLKPSTFVTIQLATRNSQIIQRMAKAAVKTQTYKNFIGGQWVKPANGQMMDNLNPADTREVVGRFPASTAEDVEAAVKAAQEALPRWKAVPAPKRAEILYRAGEILMQRKEKFAPDMTREMGKVLKEARGDVQEAIDMTFYTAGEGRRLHGYTTPSEMPHKFAMCVRQPIRPLFTNYTVEFCRWRFRRGR